MRICIVAPKIVPFFQSGSSTQYGGAEAQAAFLAGALASVGHEVTLVVTNLGLGDSLPYPAENAFDSNQGLPVVRFFYPRLPGIYKALERADADLYYQRNAAMITGVIAFFCRRHKRTFVFGAGSDTDLSFRTVRVNGIRDRLFFYAGLRMADGIVAQNRYQAELCERNFGKPVRVIANGIDIAAEPGGQGDYVVWMGAIRRVKQPELFLELARRLPDRSFVMIGGPSVNETRFSEQVAADAQEIPNLKMLGHVPHGEALQWLSRAGLLVNTSRVEGFPNAYLEAWSYGLPVVSFNDIDDLIEHERLGAVCSDIDDMALKVRRLTGDSAENNAIGKRARSVLESRFSARVLVREYEAFFDELTRSATPAPQAGR